MQKPFNIQINLIKLREVILTNDEITQEIQNYSLVPLYE